MGKIYGLSSVQEKQVQRQRCESINRSQQPEIWRCIVVQTGYLVDASDRGSVQGEYLNIQKVFVVNLIFREGQLTKDSPRLGIT